MEGLLLQSREALDVEENLLCPGASHASVPGQILTRSTDTECHCIFQHAVSMERVIFQGKARRKCNLHKNQKNFQCKPCSKYKTQKQGLFYGQLTAQDIKVMFR